ncbi:MAG: hypothetical protein R3A80_02310 [Bdellovibrionota bacterium]
MLTRKPQFLSSWTHKRALAREILGDSTLLREATPDLAQDRGRFDLMLYKGRLGIRGPQKSSDAWDFDFNENFEVESLSVGLRTFIEEFQEKLPLLVPFFESAQIRFRFDGKATYGIWLDTKREFMDAFSKSEAFVNLKKEIHVELGHTFDFSTPIPHVWLPSFSCHNEELAVQSYVSSFSQPGPEANRALIACGLELLDEIAIHDWIEVGAGYGNLTAAYASLYSSPRWVLERESKDAKLFELNKRFFPEAEFYPRGVESISQNEKVDLLLADPPRSGFSDFFKKDLVQSRYVLLYNCDLRGLLKDSEALKAHYSLKKWSLVDVFPGTPYVEAITLWERQ